MLQLHLNVWEGIPKLDIPQALLNSKQLQDILDNGGESGVTYESTVKTNVLKLTFDIHRWATHSAVKGPDSA